MSKHTPGPWRLEGRRIMSTGEDYVALIDGSGGYDSYVTATDADMRLIAAAPDLLEVVRRLVEGPIPIVSIQLAREAFTKAVGGSKCS